MAHHASERKAAARAGIAATVLVLGATGCTQLVVIPTSPAQDSPPVIGLTNFVIGGSAQIDKPEVSSRDGTNQVATVTPSGTRCEVPALTILGSAKNPGGVREFSLRVFQASNPQPKYEVRTSATATEGKGPDLLSIPGSDGRGGVGSEPLKIEFGGGKAGCPLDNVFRVSATATNFNNQTTSFDEEIRSSLAGHPSTTGCVCE